MITYIALFRGINVGGKNLLPMKALVSILEDMDCQNIKTYIQSGNAVFQCKKNRRKNIAEDLSVRILDAYGFAPKVLLLDAAGLEDAITNNPFETDNGKALHFYFLDSQPKEARLEQLMAVQSPSEKFKLHNNVFYLYAPDGIGRSKLAAKVEQSLGVPVTARNWNTIGKLIAMVAPA
ncbi:MAG: DUF1697 domain-containing protein [Gammaproteobacteria bacterium]|nr:DUF1697 domain-containing protein [Gammaproteobacteria bacterium]